MSEEVRFIIQIPINPPLCYNIGILNRITWLNEVLDLWLKYLSNKQKDNKNRIEIYTAYIKIMPDSDCIKYK